MKHAFKNFQIQAGAAELIEKLAPDHRAVLSASGTYGEMMAALSLTSGTLRSRLHRARASLVRLRAGETVRFVKAGR